MISKLLYFCIFVTLLSINNIDGSDSMCGSWTTYEEEKCIKIFETEGLVTFNEASKSCSQLDKSSHLLVIHSKAEQNFLNKYLFEDNKLVENIWIGMSNLTNTKIFEWTDASSIEFTNWKTGNPTKKTNYSCVQLEQDSLLWANEPCNKKGLVVCQKLPDITDLMKHLLEVKEDLKENKEKVKISEEMTIKLEKELKNATEEYKVNKDSLEKSETNFKETSQKMLKIFYRKTVRYSQMFTDINGNMKAFIIPSDGMKNQTFEDSVNLCKSFNSTLIEIESQEKEDNLKKFLNTLGGDVLSNEFNHFWINGFRDSSGVWKWLKSNTTFIFTNWYTNNHETDLRFNHIIVETSNPDILGKWISVPITDANYVYNVMCERTFEF